MKLRAATLLLALRAAAAADPRGQEDPVHVRELRRDLQSSGDNIADGDCASDFDFNFDESNLAVMNENVRKDAADTAYAMALDFTGTELAAGHTLILTGEDRTVEVTGTMLVDRLNGWSPVLNGNRVQVNLRRDANAEGLDSRSRVKINGFRAEGVCSPTAQSICGDTDDRTFSSDQRQGRMGGCTAWLISEDVFIWAGHCGTPSIATRLHLGVTQTPGSAPVEKQFAVEQGTYEGANGGVGNDWGVGRLLPNAVTGLKAGESNGGAGWYELGEVPSSTSGAVIRITGYGTAATNSRWQKTHTGALTSIRSSYLNYVPDTTGGNSGSPVELESTGKAIGVHTHGGCHANGGSNSGTRIDKPEFAAKIASMLTPTPPPTPPPTSPPTQSPIVGPPPPVEGAVIVDLFRMQFTFNPANACLVPSGANVSGSSPAECGQACAVLKNCAGFGQIADGGCFLATAAPNGCGGGSQPNGKFYERSSYLFSD